MPGWIRSFSSSNLFRYFFSPVSPWHIIHTTKGGVQDTIPFPLSTIPWHLSLSNNYWSRFLSHNGKSILTCPSVSYGWEWVVYSEAHLGRTKLPPTIKPTWQLQEVGSPPLPSPFRCLEGQWPQILIGEDAGIRGITLHRLPRATVTPRSQVGKTALGTASASLVRRLLLWLHRQRFTVRLRQVTGGLAITPPTCHHAVRTGAIQRMV